MKDKLDLDIAKDGIDYFMDFRMEELKSDDQYYLEHIIKYIEYLEFQIDIKNEVLSKIDNHIKDRNK
tara:strand:+ start:4334 stop:4534 length:201 start_codon:yes stop_codon:yes gene_type:complete